MDIFDNKPSHGLDSVLLGKIIGIGSDATTDLKDVDKDITDCMMGIWNSRNGDIDVLKTVKGILYSLMELRTAKCGDKVNDKHSNMKLDNDNQSPTNAFLIASFEKKMRKDDESEEEINYKPNDIDSDNNNLVVQYSKFHRSIVMIYAINTYYKCLKQFIPSKSIINLLKNFASSVLDDLILPFCSYSHGFSIIFDHHILTKRLYTFLENTFSSPTEHQTVKLFKFYSLYLKTQRDIIQSFLQVFCCKMLFIKGKFDLVYELILKYTIHNIDGVDKLNLEKQDMSNHYYILAKSSMQSNNWKLAHQLFQTMFLITDFNDRILLGRFNLIYILNEYVVILMKLGINWQDKDPFFFTYYDIVSPYLVSCYLSYSKLNYTDFVLRYLTFSITTLPADPYDEIDLNESNFIVGQKTFFTEILLKELCEQLLKAKRNSFRKNIHDENLVGKLLNDHSNQEINSAMNRLNINVNMKNVKVSPDVTRSTDNELLKKLQTLISINTELNNVLNDVRSFRNSAKNFD